MIIPLRNSIIKIYQSCVNDFGVSDLLQHAFLEVLLMPNEKLQDLHERGKLKAYIVGIVYKQSGWKNSSFNKSKRKEELITELPEIEDVAEFCLDDKRANEILDSIYWYEAEIFRLYVQYGSLQKITDLTMIPKNSIYHTVKNVREKLKKELCR